MINDSIRNDQGVEQYLNLTYVIAGIVMLLIGVAAALWGYNTGNDCKSFTGVVGQFVNRDIQQQCQYTTGALGIGIVFLIVGIILMVGGSTSKEEEQTLK